MRRTATPHRGSEFLSVQQGLLGLKAVTLQSQPSCGANALGAKCTGKMEGQARPFSCSRASLYPPRILPIWAKQMVPARLKALGSVHAAAAAWLLCQQQGMDSLPAGVNLAGEHMLVGVILYSWGLRW